MPRNKSHTAPFIYTNYRVLNKDGEHIFNTNDKKFNWYLSRNLAIRVDEQTIKLTFETFGNGHLGDNFYLQERDNHCVVCGNTKDLTRHHLVPHCYSTFFPDELKRLSYDVLPVCLECHEAYEKEANLFKQELLVEYNVARNNITFDKAMGEASSAAKALTGAHKDKIPVARKEFLLNIIKNYLGVENITEKELDFAAGLLYKKIDSKPAETLVAKITNLDAFCVRWRKHFIVKTAPKFMPDHWDIERPLQARIVRK